MKNFNRMQVANKLSEMIKINTVEIKGDKSNF